MKTKTLTAVLLIFFVITSCTPQLSQSHPVAYLEQTLTVSKCKNPCWLGIEPGTTSDVKHIEEILIQFYGEESVYTNPKASLVVFWRVNDIGLPQHGAAVLNENKEIVYTQVFFDEYRITIDNLISAIGEPQYVLLHGYNSQQDFHCDGIWGVLYLENGLEILTIRTTESIRQSQFIGYIGIEEPSTLNGNHWWSNPYTYKTVEWKGYGNYCINN